MDKSNRKSDVINECSLKLKVSQTQNEFMKTSIFQNSNENIVRISALKFLVLPSGFLEAFGGFLGT